MRTTRAPRLLGLGLALCLTMPALAGPGASPGGLGETAVLLVPRTGFSPEVQRGIRNAVLGRALAHSGTGLAWQLVTFASLPPSRSPQARLAEVQARLEKGKQQYRYLKLDEARTTLAGAYAYLGAEPAAACQAESVAALLFYWARAVLDSGDRDGARGILAMIPRFDPEAGPDPAVMPPKLVADFDLALAERQGRPEARLSLRLGPAAGTLWVDCRRQAAGEAQVQGRAGERVLISAEVSGGTIGASLPLYRGEQRSLRIHSGQPNDETFLARQLAGLKAERALLASVEARGNAELDALAGILGVRLLLLAEPVQAVGGRYVRLGLYAPGHHLLAKPVDVPLDDAGVPDPAQLEQALAKLAALGRSPSVLAALAGANTQRPDPAVAADQAPPAATDQPDPEDDRAAAAVVATPWYETWWFWTAAGVLVAGAVGTGVGLGLSQADGGPSGQVILSIDQPR